MQMKGQLWQCIKGFDYTTASFISRLVSSSKLLNWSIWLLKCIKVYDYSSAKGKEHFPLRKQAEGCVMDSHAMILGLIWVLHLLINEFRYHQNYMRVWSLHPMTSLSYLLINFFCTTDCKTNDVYCNWQLFLLKKVRKWKFWTSWHTCRLQKV